MTFVLHARMSTVIIRPPRHQIAIHIIAALSSRLSRYTKAPLLLCPPAMVALMPIPGQTASQRRKAFIMSCDHLGLMRLLEWGPPRNDPEAGWRPAANTVRATLNPIQLAGIVLVHNHCISSSLAAASRYVRTARSSIEYSRFAVLNERRCGSHCWPVSKRPEPRHCRDNIMTLPRP